MKDNDITLDRASRVVELIDFGVDVSVIRLCLERSSDGDDLGAALGLVEDLVELGFRLGKPQK